MEQNINFYSRKEEIANSISHLIGVIMGIVCGAILITRAALAGNTLGIISFALFTFGMIVSLGASSLYHIAQNPKKKKILRYFDHGAIYLLIAGTYSPMLLLVLGNNAWGWTMFIVVWICSLTGIGLNFKKMKKNSNIKTLLYVLLGWMIVIAAKPLWTSIDSLNAHGILIWICIGGLFYTSGAIIYAKAKREYIHFIWHIFVLIAAAAFEVVMFLIPLK